MPLQKAATAGKYREKLEWASVGIYGTRSATHVIRVVFVVVGELHDAVGALRGERGRREK